MESTRLPIHLKEFLKLMISHNDLLVGGYAVAFHGYPRATVDVDIWIERSEGNADRVIGLNIH